MEIYKSNVETKLKHLVILNLTLFVAFSLRDFDVSNFWLMAIVDIIYFVSLTFKKQPVKIVIDKENNLFKVESATLFFSRKEASYSLNSLKCSYKSEVRHKGIRYMVFKIINDQETVVEIFPDYGDGWSDSTLITIFRSFHPV